MDADTKFLMDEVISLNKKTSQLIGEGQMNGKIILNLSEIMKEHSRRIEFLESALMKASDTIEELRYQVDKLKPSGYND